MSSGESLIEVPSTPTPSTSDISIAQQQQVQPQPQQLKEAFKIPDLLYSAVFSILWLFGLARNLASYVVSLGIIPLKTATRLFGIKERPEDAQKQPRPTRQIRSDKPAGASKRQAWSAHKSSQPSATSTSASSSILRIGSVPSSPSTRRVSLPPVEPATDSEQIAHRPRNRHSAPGPSARRFVLGDVVVNEDDIIARTRSRNRVDHSTRRILFVDHKHARRQTAPPVPYTDTQEVTESPVQENVPLPREPQQPTSSTPRPKSSPEQPISRPNTNEFGEFVSAPAPATTSQTAPARFPGEHDREATAAASGTESTSERKSRGKTRLRSLFGKKRSESVASAASGDAITPVGAHETGSKNCSNRLRRKSPYPTAVAVSDVESTTSTWLRSRPRKLSRKARSNSLSEGSRTQPIPVPASCIPPGDSVAPPHATPLQLPTAPVPLLRSSTMASTSTSTSANSSSSTPAKNGPAGFNPIRELEARLYRHGVGTGPGTYDALAYVTTPVPKTGIKRTNPYVLLGMERPAPSSPRIDKTLLATGKKNSSSSASTLPAPPRRVSAPAEESGLKRPVTPRAHTQPL